MKSRLFAVWKTVANTAGILAALVSISLAADKTTPSSIDSHVPSLSPSSAAPSTAPADPRQANLAAITQWFEQLADGNPKIRDNARYNLMGLPVSDLQILRAVALSHRPLQPSQSSALHDIVMNVFLSGANYERTGDGFIGIQLELSPGDGIRVCNRWPGFGAYRSLEDNDVVLRVEQGRPQFASLPPPVVVGDGSGDEIISIEQFKQIVRASPPGTPLIFTVRRLGRLMRLPVIVSARPAASSMGYPEERYSEPEPGSLEAILEQRMVSANEYWQAKFEELVDGKSH